MGVELSFCVVVTLSKNVEYGIVCFILVVRKFKIICKGFVFGYDIEITIPIFFVYN